MEWRYPAWRQDRIDNERLSLLLAYTLDANSNCVDVGAHKGVVLRDMARLAPEGRHVAYEALPELATQLRAEFPQATVEQAAVGNHAGETTFMRNRTILGQSGIHGRRELGDQDLEPFTVKMVTLDESLPDDYVPSVIKVDVEGAEALVFEGARRVLRSRPTLWFEHGRDAAREYGSTPGDVFGLLNDLGYRIFDVHGGGPYTVSEFSSPPPLTWSFIAH